MLHLSPLVLTKLRKLIEQDSFEEVPTGVSKWPSPIVVLRKSNRDIEKRWDYRIGVNDKVCTDS